jgi:hypothetical protein
LVTKPEEREFRGTELGTPAILLDWVVGLAVVVLGVVVPVVAPLSSLLITLPFCVEKIVA